MCAGFVDYFPHDTIVDITPFKKQLDLFGYQNEFRLCAETDNYNKFLMFDLHRTLRDIVIPIKTDVFLESVTLGDNEFHFDSQAIIK
jgi:hypothetical protein